jgi:hypothetical protein
MDDCFSLASGSGTMPSEWRRARFKISPLSITLFVLVLFWVVMLVWDRVVLGASALRLLTLAGAFIVPCALLVCLALSFKLRLSHEGLELKTFLSPTRRARWDEIRLFLLTDDYRVILKAPGARDIVIVPGTYRDPEQVVRDIAEHLGEPRLQETDFLQFASRALIIVIAVVACSIPLVLLTSTISWAAGLVSGLPLGVYLLRKHSGPVTWRRGFRLWAPVIGWWGVTLSMVLGMALPRLVGLGSAPGMLPLLTGANGYVVGSFGLFGLVTKLRLRIGRG